MNIFYCPNCEKWRDAECIVNVTPPSGVGDIEPHDPVFMCDCGATFGEDILEDYVIEEFELLEFLEEKGVKIEYNNDTSSH